MIINFSPVIGTEIRMSCHSIPFSYIWSTLNQACIRPYFGQQLPPTVFLWSFISGHVILKSFWYMYLSGADCKTLLWDVGQGEILAELDLPDLLYSIGFSYNGEQVVSTCKDKFLRVHNARTLEVVKVHGADETSRATISTPDQIHRPTCNTYQ